MFKCFIYLSLTCICFCKNVFCFLKLTGKGLPGCNCVICLCQSLCSFHFCFKTCKISWLHCRIYDILCSCLEAVGIVIISKSIHCQFPVSCSVCSSRKLAACRFCKSKLDSHCFMHPVICGKLGPIRSEAFCICGIISIIIPAYSLHICTKIAIISIEIHTEEFAVASACCFYTRLDPCCCF